MLSSQTKDEVNYEAMKNLHNGLLKVHPDGLCIESVLKLSESEIDAYIKKLDSIIGKHSTLEKPVLY